MGRDFEATLLVAFLAAVLFGIIIATITYGITKIFTFISIGWFVAFIAISVIIMGQLAHNKHKKSIVVK